MPPYACTAVEASDMKTAIVTIAFLSRAHARRRQWYWIAALSKSPTTHASQLPSANRLRLST